MGTLHFLAAGDTGDAAIGETVKIDLAAFPKLVEAAAATAGLQYSWDVVSGPRFQADALHAQVSRLQVGPDDVVVYYYSGHGARGENKHDAWPVMSLGESDFGALDVLDIGWVYQALRRKQPRLLIVVTDCCQQEVPDEWLNEVTAKSARRRSFRASAAHALFRAFSGEILVMSCRPGELSSCNVALGGYFTHRLLSALDAALAGAMSPAWEEILDASARIDATQNPIWKVVDARNAIATAAGLEPYPGSWRCLAAGRPVTRRAAARPRRVAPRATAQPRAAAVPRAAAAPQTMPTVQAYCPQCGVSFRPRARFCVQCGTARREIR